MDRWIPYLYRSYGIYVNTEKMLPHYIDGLTPVQKRILLTSHLIAKNKFVKTTKLLGECMVRFHPHSESVGTVDIAVQNGFLIGDGNWGDFFSIDKTECAAPRYTSVKINPAIDELAFKYIDYVNWIKFETDDLEPEYIPTMIPFCLISKIEINFMGFGFKTEIPTYNFSHLIKRLLYLIGEGNGKKPLLKPSIHGCKVLSTPTECECLLTKGVGRIAIQGKYTVNEVKREIYVYGWSQRVGFEKGVLGQIDKYKKLNLISNGDVGYIDASTYIIFKVAKQTKRDEIFKNMKEAIDEALKYQVGFQINLTDGKVVYQSCVDDMLKRAFESQKTVVENYTTITLNKVKDKIREYETIDAIRPFINEVLSDEELRNDIPRACSYLSDKTGGEFTQEEIQVVVEKYRIKKLMSTKVDTDELLEEKRKLEEDLNDIHGVCVRKYKSLINGG